MTRKERAITNLKQMCSDGRYLGSGSYVPLEVLEDFNLAIKSLEQEPRWIPTSERLPEEHSRYLVSFKQGYVTTDFWVGNIQKWKEVIAWMPLPKAYREVEE